MYIIKIPNIYTNYVQKIYIYIYLYIFAYFNY